jgi:SAM-dependent methyltransferase
MAAAVQRHHGRRPGRVLNIGIGAGGLEKLLKNRGWAVSSLDPSRDTVEAQVKLGMDAHCGYAQRMPFSDAAFDVVVASEVLEHIEPDIRVEVLAEIARVLADGGWFIGSVPYREHLPDNEVICPDCGKIFHRWGHVSSFDQPQLRAELAARFEVVSCTRRSFVDWAAARTPLRMLKAVAQSVLGRLGEQIASPSINFAARLSARR